MTDLCYAYECSKFIIHISRCTLTNTNILSIYLSTNRVDIDLILRNHSFYWTCQQHWHAEKHWIWIRSERKQIHRTKSNKRIDKNQQILRRKTIQAQLIISLSRINWPFYANERTSHFNEWRHIKNIFIIFMYIQQYVHRIEQIELYLPMATLKFKISFQKQKKAKQM